MKRTFYPFYGDTAYPISILVITDNSAQVLRVRQWLDRSNCQVHWLDPGSNRLPTTQHNYYDLIVLDVESPGINNCTVCQQLTKDAELAAIPVVLLTRCRNSKEPGQKVALEPAFYIAQDSSPKAALRQIVEEVRYMTLRYM